MRTGVKMTLDEENIGFSFAGNVILKKRLDDIVSVSMTKVDWQIVKWILIRFVDETVKMNAGLKSKRLIYDALSTRFNSKK